MEGLYLLARKVVEKRFPYDKDIQPLFIAALYGLLRKYKNYSNIVCDIFLQTDIFIKKKTIDEILEEHNIEAEYDSDGNNRTYAISSLGYEFIYDTDKGVTCEKGPSFIACSLLDVDLAHVLNSFVHEMSHLIKSVIRSHAIIQDKNKPEYYLRSGVSLFLYQYNIKKDIMKSCCQFSGLDEAINTVQTTEILNDILSLRKFVDDRDMVKFFNDINISNMKKDCGYEDITILFRKIWCIPSFRDLIEENIVEGDIDTIIYKFNELFSDKYAFFRFASIFDEYDTLDNSMENQKIKNQMLKEFKRCLNKFKSLEKKHIKRL